MPALNVWLQIYGQKQTHIIYLKLFKTANISLHFSTLSMWNQITKLQTKIWITQQHNKSKLKNTE